MFTFKEHNFFFLLKILLFAYTIIKILNCVCDLFLENTLKCYYCDGREMGEGHSCNEDEHGVEISCQTDDEDGEHFGDSCAVAHTGSLFLLFGVKYCQSKCYLKYPFKASNTKFYK